MYQKQKKTNRYSKKHLGKTIQFLNVEFIKNEDTLSINWKSIRQFQYQDLEKLLANLGNYAASEILCGEPKRSFLKCRVIQKKLLIEELIE